MNTSNQHVPGLGSQAPRLSRLPAGAGRQPLVPQPALGGVLLPGRLVDWVQRKLAAELGVGKGTKQS